MTNRTDAVEFARAYFEDNPPLRLDRRDLAYFFIAAQLLQKDSPLEKRLQAIELLEEQLYPDGRKDSLVRAFTGKRPRKRTRGRGGDSFAYKMRDFRIVYVINEICKRFKPLKPTRNRAAKDKGKIDSACSIVVEALRLVDIHMNEEAVEKIWYGRNNLWPTDAGPVPKGFPV